MVARVVLVGAGHAHVSLLRKEMKKSVREAEWMLISPSRYQYYSGMYAGFIEGLYSEPEIRIDVKRLCEKAGIRFIEDAVSQLYPQRKELHTEGGSVVSYDLLSFNIGSSAAWEHVPGAEQYAHTIKPTHRLPTVVQQVKGAKNLAIVGGGAAGVEVAFAFQSYNEKHGSYQTTSLLTKGEIMEDLREEDKALLKNELERAGVQLYEQAAVKEMTPSSLITRQEKIPYDKAIWLAGSGAPPLFANADLAGEDGFLPVKHTLQSIEDPDIFGAGDCITVQSHPDLPKNGVYALSHTPVLHENLLRRLRRHSLRPYRPQERYLAIISLGKRKALLLYGGRSFIGRLSWRLKDRIDTRFMKKFK
ncbi:FAD-dependent oxidoreductase [Salsuginibacillus kocurii]|uniref:FAD-dependent oxidoreductase n=1 Tax=Salsuginibacillus kocurii TaxID=427078 RepID=UPI000368823B|nr:FAD-dependent oxidoreductase [Salsuginibacillus kocurii]